jgi:hypothetical protein
MEESKLCSIEILLATMSEDTVFALKNDHAIIRERWRTDMESWLAQLNVLFGKPRADLNEKQVKALMFAEKELITCDFHGVKVKKEALYRLVHALMEWPDAVVSEEKSGSTEGAVKANTR